jgi:sterile alpha motif and leucine zipper-containing kinase AZK
MLSHLRHPNIVQVLACCPNPPNLAIVMEFMPRGGLFNVLHQSDIEMTKARKQSISIQAIQGVLFCHLNGIVHRDIKSHNFLLDEHLKVKLCDFGLARQLNSFSDQKEAEVCGTPAYMAPEIWNKQQPSIYSDVYACGIILNEIWTREVPMDGLDPQTIKQKCLDNKRPELSKSKETPQKLNALIMEMLDPNPQKRPHLSNVLSILTSL